ncbi:proline dehydrogenase family protein [Frankia sp. AgB32]|uniref:proline dehydrogenase family protein n=1 Tax=Frankia sp. AgB32 TaxID=631119 RepID=UPI00200C8A57|nr:proline dehydrogenase family protein [Frankia sp. AgB32]MCK9895862.1 proline dehydrogenase family protein [Frankia sp. AgB32]
MIRDLVPRIVATTPVRAGLAHGPLSAAFVDRFVAGPTEADAVRAVARLAGLGLTATVDRLGEGVTEPAEALATVGAYRCLLDLADQAGFADGLDLSVKLSALGQAVPRDGHKVSYENAAEIAGRAAAVNATVTLDMEDHTTTDATLDTVRDLRRDFPTVGAVLQAQLRRTEADCRDLAHGGSRVRLCKGAYREPAAVSYRDRSGVTAAYARCLGILLSGAGYPMIATHDPALIALADRLVEAHGRPPGSYEYQMLYGIRPGEQQRLAAREVTVRVYLPYGPDCVPYLSRRIVEKPSNLLLALRALGPARRDE